MIEIYVVRHGKTEFNNKGLIMGQIDSPLLDSSIKDSEEIANKVKNIQFDRIFSSPIGRALVTAEIITKKLKHKTKLVLAKQLKEIDYGIFAGKLKKEISKKYPRYHNDPAYVNPKGESFNQLYNRVVSLILKQEKRYKRILLVTHAGCIRTIYSFFSKKELKDIINIKLGHKVIMKCILDKQQPVSVKIIHR